MSIIAQLLLGVVIIAITELNSRGRNKPPAPEPSTDDLIRQLRELQMQSEIIDRMAQNNRIICAQISSDRITAAPLSGNAIDIYKWG